MNMVLKDQIPSKFIETKVTTYVLKSIIFGVRKN
jgi:hypothetical protein